MIVLFAVERKKKRVKKADANVLLLRMNILEDDPQIVTGDPVHCAGCDAILSSTSTLERAEGEQHSIWIWYGVFLCRAVYPTNIGSYETYIIYVHY